jgi:hypothetical protein
MKKTLSIHRGNGEDGEFTLVMKEYEKTLTGADLRKEGNKLADALYSNLPAVTFDVMLARLLKLRLNNGFGRR